MAIAAAENVQVYPLFFFKTCEWKYSSIAVVAFAASSTRVPARTSAGFWNCTRQCDPTRDTRAIKFLEEYVYAISLFSAMSRRPNNDNFSLTNTFFLLRPEGCSRNCIDQSIYLIYMQDQLTSMADLVDNNAAVPLQGICKISSCLLSIHVFLFVINMNMHTKDVRLFLFGSTWSGIQCRTTFTRLIWIKNNYIEGLPVFR